MCTMFFSEITSFVAALLFAVHPIHAEAVSVMFLFTKNILFSHLFEFRLAILFASITNTNNRRTRKEKERERESSPRAPRLFAYKFLFDSCEVAMK